MVGASLAPARLGLGRDGRCPEQGATALAGEPTKMRVTIYTWSGTNGSL
jgi:hypothetical protein